MPKNLHQRLAQDLRNAYDLRSRPDFEDTLKRLEKLGEILPVENCTRGNACVCNQHVKDVCMYRVPEK